MLISNENYLKKQRKEIKVIEIFTTVKANAVNMRRRYHRKNLLLRGE